MKVYQGKPKTVKQESTIYAPILDTSILEERASEGLLSLSVEIGLEVLRQMMEKDVAEVAGPKGKHQNERTAYRHGVEKSRIVFGGEKVPIERPRVRSVSGEEIEIPSLLHFQQEDPLNEAILSRLLSGVSARKYSRTLDVQSQNASCVSKSEVSRRFAAGLQTQMEAFFQRPIQENYPVLMIDGLTMGKLVIVAALGISETGEKRILGLVEGGSENSDMVKALLSDLCQRGLEQQQHRLFVLDGAKALSKAVNDTFGDYATIQRCQVHKKRNVLSHLPQSEQAHVARKLSLAYSEFEFQSAHAALRSLADYLENRYPKAAASLLEGLDETLTVHRLEVPGLLRETLCSTNPIESANSSCVGVLRRVSHFQNGKMTLRHAVAGFLEAEKGFRRVRGYKEFPELILALQNLTKGERSATLIST